MTEVSATHVIVGGVNQVKKNQRPNPMKGEQGGIVNKDMFSTSPTSRCEPGDAEG